MLLQQSGIGPADRPALEVVEALHLLDKRDLVLAIHDASFPGDPGEDLGRGTPYSGAGLRMLAFARRLGFNGLQLGPQGLTTRGNASPYDSTLFSRNLLSLALVPLADDPKWLSLLSRETLDGLLANAEGDRRRTHYHYAWDAAMAAVAEAFERFTIRSQAEDPALDPMVAELDAFRARNRPWLIPDALYEALSSLHGSANWLEWPGEGPGALDRHLYAAPPERREAYRARETELIRRNRRAVDFYAFVQFLVHRQHVSFHQILRSLGMKLYGDLQVGMSPRDSWRLQAAFLPGYRMGAPPSRTNPEGQPWGYFVLDPRRYYDADGSPGVALRAFSDRLGKMFEEYDAIRLDHPHGLVCPWVYRTDIADSVEAVQRGARLYESPDLPDHPELAALAIARPEQLTRDPAVARHADAWVRELDDEQVARYGILVRTVVEAARAHGHRPDDVVCEVLSTQPYPLRRVMEHYGLGRFRVTQKACLDDPNDVYRSENAAPQDWIMVGNHDTAPIWALARRWHGTEAGREQAHYLARRLQPDGDAEALARELAADPGALVHAKVADIFASRARHVLVFFPDLFGQEDTYNVPGTVNEENWSLRVPPDYAIRHREDAAEGKALDLRKVLAMALRARGTDFARTHAPLIERLRQPE